MNDDKSSVACAETSRGLRGGNENRPAIDDGYLVNVFINALQGMQRPPNGYIHMIVSAPTDAPHSCGRLFAHAVTQVYKERLDRAARAVGVCIPNAQRQKQHLVAAALLKEPHHHNGNGDARSPLSHLTDERHDFIMGWLRHSKRDEILVANKGPNATRRAGRIQWALTSISTRIETKFTTTELANICCVGARTISDDFRAAFPRAVLAYLTKEQMQVALELLQDRSLPLSKWPAKLVSSICSS